MDESRRAESVQGSQGHALPRIAGITGVALVALSASAWVDSRLAASAAVVLDYSPFLASFIAAEVFRELGIALILVAVATVSIEAARVRQFSSELAAIVDAKLEQIERTASDAILRGPLPKPYYEHVKRLMLLKPFLRSDWRINLVFTPRDDGFEVLFDQHFRVTNLASIAQTYTVVHHESQDQGR